MEILEFDSIFDNNKSFEDLKDYVEQNKEGFKLKIEYSYIGSARSPIDIMRDHLEMSFCIEKFLDYADLIDYEKNYKFRQSITFTIIPTQIDELANELYELCILKSHVKDPDENDIWSLNEELNEYEETISDATLKFPEAIDDYYANLINGGLEEITGQSMYDDDYGEQDEKEEEEKSLRDYYNENPEWQWGIWKSAISNTLKESFFVSTYCWIIPIDSNHSKILEHYSGFKRKINFELAAIVEYDNKKIAINDFGALRIDNLVSLTAAVQCSKMALSKSKKFAPHEFSFSNFKISISEFRDVLMLENEKFRFIYFDFEILSHEEIKKMWDTLSPSVASIQSLLGTTVKLSCDWTKLDDEKFEELCYDILYLNTKFDSSRLRKMGKSKSRDGGRDIIAFTNSAFGQEPEMYIFQCKLIKSNSSLTKSKVPEAANTIMEYNANGYGIFTSAVIDATLHDMLTGFTSNQKINTDIRFSIYELERFLARNVALKGKYFK